MRRLLLLLDVVVGVRRPCLLQLQPRLLDLRPLSADVLVGAGLVGRVHGQDADRLAAARPLVVSGACAWCCQRYVVSAVVGTGTPTGTVEAPPHT